MNNEDDFDFLIEENVEPFVTENKVIAINHHEIEEEEDDFRDPLPRNSIAHMSTIQYERDRPSVWNGFISLHAAPAKDIYKYDELKDALRNEYIDAIVSRLEDHEDELREITRENDRADANAPEHIPIGTILCGAYSREHFDRNSHDYIVTRHRAPPHRKIFVNLALLRVKPLANPEFVRGRHQYEMYGYSNRYYRKRRANRVIIDEWEQFGAGDMADDNDGINLFRTGFKGCAILQTLRDPIWIMITSSWQTDTNAILFGVTAQFYNVLKNCDVDILHNDETKAHAYVFGQHRDFAEYKFVGEYEILSRKARCLFICQANNLNSIDNGHLYQGARWNDFKKNYVGAPTDKFPNRSESFDDPLVLSFAQHQFSQRFLFLAKCRQNNNRIDVYLHLNNSSVDGLILDAGYFEE